MQSWFDKERIFLIQCATAALRDHAGLNRSSLPPFRLPQLAQQLTAGLIDFAAGKGTPGAAAIGSQVGTQGLTLGSLQGLGSRLLKESLARHAEPEQLLQLHDYLSIITGALVEADGQELRRQRDEMQGALERALRSREDALRNLVQELSTPIMPIYDGILVLPLVGQIDDERANKITEKLLDEITAQRAHTVIIDITGVPNMDVHVATGLVRAAQAAQLLGATALLVGIRPEIARTLVQLGIETGGLKTLANLRSGIEYALRQQGLSVRAVATESARIPAAGKRTPVRASAPNTEKAS